MFFLAVLTWATLTTEAPRIVRVYKTLEECAAVRDQANKTWPPSGPNHEPPAQRAICLKAVPEA